ncbi:MAG: FixH family protein [Cytophagales bacterium]|nr:FixH family protein [Cytophagales bacterium]
MNWGKSIVLVIVMFMGFITFLVTKMVGQKVDLVQDGYYKSDLEYEKQQRKEKNYLSWKDPIQVEMNSTELELGFPAEIMGPDVTGTVVLFRPANKREDKLFMLKLNPEGKQQVPINGLAKGLWKLKIDGKVGAEGFYMEKELMFQ